MLNLINDIAAEIRKLDTIRYYGYTTDQLNWKFQKNQLEKLEAAKAA